MVRTDRNRRVARRSLVAVVVGVLILGLTACGGTIDSGKRNTAAAVKSLSGELQAKYDALFAEGFKHPPSDIPAAVKGKKVWLISCGKQFPVCTRIDDQFEKAGKILGWDVNVYDSAGDAQKTINGIRLAIAANADAVPVIAADCAGIKSALLEAKRADVPVFGYHSIDCSPNLYTAGLRFAGSDNYLDYAKAAGKASAILTAALLAKRGITSGKVLQIKSVGQQTHDASWAVYEDELKVDCPKCELVKVEFNNAQVPNPASQIWRTAVTAHPDAVGLTFDSDTYLSKGLDTAIKASANKNLVVCCGSGENPEALLDGTVTGAAFEPYEYYTWALADTLNQFFSGVATGALPDEGGGPIMIDADHGMPAKGEGYKVPFDYEQIYTNAWTK